MTGRAAACSIGADGASPVARAIASLWVMGGLFGCSEAEPPDRSRDAPARFVEVIDSLRTEARIPGLAVAVVQEGDVVLAEGLGVADLEAGQPVSPSTPFRIASVTKPISATMALMLRDAGRLDLDRPMQTFTGFSELCDEAVQAGGIFFDDWACRDPDLTLRHVLSMTSNGTPGSRFYYNPVSYSWASRPMAQAAGRSFSELVHDSILEPAGMNRSARVHRDRPLPDELATELARPHVLREDGEIIPAPPPPPQGDGAAGGIVSTALDLAAFDLALDNGTLLGAESREEMWTPMGPGIPYGLGWFVTDDLGERAVWHTGWWEDAYSALYLKLPERRATLILLANSEGLWWNMRLDEATLAESPFARAFHDFIVSSVDEKDAPRSP